MDKTNLIRSFKIKTVQLERKLDQINIYHILLLCLLLAAFSIAYHQGGIADSETEAHLPYYLSNIPLLNKLFDSRTLDTFRARELSYLFDYFDSQFIAWSVSLGYPHFLSLTHYVFSILISYILWQFMAHDLNLKPWLGAGVIVLLWTSPAVFLGGVFFRSAKIGVALTTALLYLLIYRILHNTDAGQPLPATLWIACFLLSLSGDLLDEEGIFMTGIAIIFLLIWICSFPSKNVMKLIGAFAASLLVELLYRYLIAPHLTLYLNHYWPDFSFQKLPWKHLFRRPFFYIREGMVLWAYTVKFLFGNLPLWLAAILLVSAATIIVINILRKDEEQRGKIKVLLTALIGLVISNVVLISVMNSIMVLRHEPLLWPDVRIVYYWLPAVTLHSMTLATALSWLTKRQFASPTLLFFILTIAIVGNIYAIPQHQAVIAQGHLKSYFESSPALLDALRNIRNTGYPVSSAIGQDAIYQFFRNTVTHQ